MEYTFLGDTGVRVSRLCMGTMTFGAQADEQACKEIMHACFDAGINHFDCADMYADGTSEEILGRLIGDRRDDVVLATKAYFPVGDGPNDRGASRYHIVRACEASLERLGTDRVDIFYLHRFDDNMDLEEALRGVEQLVAQGKVLYPAVSNYAAWQVTKALGLQNLRGWAPIACIQPMYNLLKRQAEVELFPMAQSERLGVFPYSPLGAGYLTGKYDRDNRPDKGRLVTNDMYKRRYGDDAYMDIAVSFTELARDLGHHPVSLAIAWAGSHPAVTAPILGARNAAQLAPAIESVDIEMTEELRAEISALSMAPATATDRSEEVDTDKDPGSR